MSRHALKRDRRCPGRIVIKGKERFGLRRKRVELKFEYQRERKQFTRHLILRSPVTVHISHLHIYPSPFLLMALYFWRTAMHSLPGNPALFPGHMPPPTSSFVSALQSPETSTLLLSKCHISLHFHLSQSSTSSHWLKASFLRMAPLPLKHSSRDLWVFQSRQEYNFDPSDIFHRPTSLALTTFEVHDLTNTWSSCSFPILVTLKMFLHILKLTQKDRVEREVGGGSGWGIHVNPWLIHVNVWQKPLQYCKVISLQLIKIKKIKIIN